MAHLSRIRSLCSVLVIAATAWMLFGLPPSTYACPFCGAPTLTLSERFAKADVAVDARWIEAQDAQASRPASTTYEIVQVLRGSAKSIEKGSRIKVDAFHSRKPSIHVLLLGTHGKAIDWGEPLELTEAALSYVVQAPPRDVTGPRRLAYFVKFLEYPDQAIANDAYAEFANAPYEDIVPIARHMPHEKLRTWLVSPAVPKNRLGLYGMMLGLCGDATDAAHLEKIILAVPPDGERLGMDGIMAGYLLLKGEKGLPLIEDTKLKSATVPDSETFAATQALRFMWTYGNGRISPERVRSAMRCLIEHPLFAEIALIDLTRWKDWSIRQQLMQMYGKPEQDPRLKRAILEYMVVASKDSVSKGSVAKGTAQKGGSLKPPHAVDAAEFLKRVRQEDPKAFADFERRFK